MITANIYIHVDEDAFISTYIYLLLSSVYTIFKMADRYH